MGVRRGRSLSVLLPREGVLRFVRLLPCKSIENGGFEM